jgi:hypothetical protein
MNGDGGQGEAVRVPLADSTLAVRSSRDDLAMTRPQERGRLEPDGFG